MSLAKHSVPGQQPEISVKRSEIYMSPNELLICMPCSRGSGYFPSSTSSIERGVQFELRVIEDQLLDTVCPI